MKNRVVQRLNDNSLELIMPCEPGYERVAMASSVALARMFGFPKSRIDDLNTVVAEATIFAMDQGRCYNPKSRVRIAINVDENSICVSVIYEGEDVFGEIHEPNIEAGIGDKTEAIGLGLFLIQKLTDLVEFERTNDGGHVIRMTIHVASQN